MTKNELIVELAKNCRTTKKNARKFLTVMMETISENLKEGDNIKLPGFGAFTVNEIAAHDAYNPRTGEKIFIPPRKNVKFKPGKSLLDVVNKSTKIVKGRNAVFF